MHGCSDLHRHGCGYADANAYLRVHGRHHRRWKRHGQGATFNTGNTTVTVTATSTCGSAATCVFTVTVTDNEAPSNLLSFEYFGE
ncbi:MAG: HYR domain-containing protein [Saprospirales bacterium]|nr:HYR domain-containing protein [Saprospirales bacterium]